MKKQSTLKSYLLEKCLIGYGIINGIINSLIFYAMEGKHQDATFAMSDILTDFAFTTFLLGIILTLCVYPLTKMDIDKNKFAIPQNEGNKFAAMLPKKKFPTALVIGLVAMVITVAICALITMVLNLPLTVKSMCIFKGVACTIAGAISGYLSINKVVFYN